LAEAVTFVSFQVDKSSAANTRDCRRVHLFHIFR